MSATNRLHIKSIRVKDLYAFACGFIDAAVDQEISPITKQRALSQSRNPYADDDDVALLVAFIDGKCVGYHGLLPVRLATPTGMSKALWGTAMYVRPEYRNRMVAVELVRQALSLKQDYVVNEFSEAAGRLCTALGFRPLPACAYLSVQLDRLDWGSLPFRALTKLSRRYGFCQNACERALMISQAFWLGLLKRWIYARLERRGREAFEGFTWKEVDRVRPLEASSSRRDVRFARDVDTVNWTLEMPWIREGGEPTRPPYFFSDVCSLFRNHALEVYGRNREYLGFVVVTILKPGDRTVLKLRDFDLGETAYEEMLFRVVLEYGARYKVDRFELPLLLERLVYREVPFASLIVQRKERPYLYHPKSDDSPLAQAGDHIRLDLNDGDTAFF